MLIVDFPFRMTLIIAYVLTNSALDGILFAILSIHASTFRESAWSPRG